MKMERCKWVCAWWLALAGCEILKGEIDEPEDEEGSSDVDTGVVTSEGSISGTGTSGYDPGDTESCSSHSETGSVSATSSTGTSVGSDVDTGSGGGAAEQCGVELIYDGSQSSFMCGCEECSVQYDGLSGASGEALLNACDCICAVTECGGSVSGGVTTNAEEDGGSWSGTGESGGGEVDGGWDTESASGTATSSTTGYGEDGG
ncbi:MAG TPA: hypothetical protein VG755_10705 [Nannocystaceae bacterium]|nr:hypothetical protein [Nannocystaceae bacterium]